MDPRDEWTPQEPPRDFVDRVMADVDRAQRRGVAGDRGRVIRGSWRVAGTALALGVAAGVALAVSAHRGAGNHGEAMVAERTQMSLGARAVAVLEGGAHVAWTGDDVDQTAGDVFYRVESGGAFRVHTPAGDVQVLGTCFRVRVASEGTTEAVVNGRDIKVGTVGAALAAAAIVSVYEGKVAVSHARESVTLTAGETARADALGVRRASADGTPSVEASAGGSSTLMAANENLADQVQDYKRRLDAIAAQKAVTEKALADAQKKLAIAESDGQVSSPRNPYDLSQDDLKDLAAKGEVRARMPCISSGETGVSVKNLEAEGLPPSDAAPINAAIAQSTTKLWGMLEPMCAQALGGKPDIAAVLGPSACQSVVFEMAKKNENTEEEIRTVAEILAGEKPMPKDPSALGQVGQLIYQESGASKALEQSLAQTIGPDDAHAFVYGDKGCWSNSSWGAGPRNPAPGTQVVTGATLPPP
jgi:ferric-dicitrate binding protein FerR (iron transport regulator)